MSKLHTLRISIPGLLLALGSQAQISPAQQFTAGHNIAPNANAGGVWATGDVNRDGKLDLIAFDQSKSSYVVLLGKGNGTFTEKVPTNAIQSWENVKLADVNGDGFLDLVADSAGPIDTDGLGIGYGTVTVYLGDGTGDFHRAPWSANIGAGTSELVVADINGDGHLDLVTATDQPYQGAGYIQVFLGDGKGSFQQKGGATYYDLLAAGDFNGDGKADLVVIGGTQPNSIQILLSNGDGTFKTGASYSVESDTYAPVSVADFNHDGHLDLAVVDGFTGVTSILLGKGNGTFTIKSQFNSGFPGYPGIQSSGMPRAVGAADFNGDGKLDLVVYGENYFLSPTSLPPTSARAGVVSVSLGNGDGTFKAATDYAASSSSGMLVTGDFNGDGHPDVVVGGFDSVNLFVPSVLQLLLGSKTGALQAPIDTLSPDPFSIVHADFNHDGIDDIALVNQGCGGCSTTVSVFLGAGKGSFGAPKTYPIALTQGSIAAGDINGDGKIDLVVTRGNQAYIPSNLYVTAAQQISSSDDTSVLLGNGNGTFRAAVNSVLLGPAGTSNMAWLVDMNRDGKLDLVGDWGVALGKGDGTFRPPVAFPTTLGEIDGVGVGDLNGDGIQDIVLFENSSGQIESLLGDGHGAFTVKSTFSYPHYFITDLKVGKIYNGSERDLVFVGQSVDAAKPQLSTNLVATVKGNGNGTFGTKKITVLPNLPLSVAFADFDRDGKLDVAVSDHLGIQYLRGTGSGSFSAPQFFPGMATYLQTLDTNRDGAPDVVGITPIGFETLLNTAKRD